MEKYYYVAVFSGSMFNPTIVEKFEDKVDAETFAALMSRTQKRNYLVLESISKWEHSSEN